jgi:glyoxylase-like metal-dependent hydrolase (beta-lactamase superfamily II)
LLRTPSRRKRRLRELPKPENWSRLSPAITSTARAHASVGIIVTDEGVVVVDSLSNEAMAKHERQLIAGTIGKPVRYLISSTFHGNYSLGNVAYPDAMKIGQENYRTDLINMMKQDKMPEAQQAAMLPHQTFRDRMTIYPGGKEIQILYLGRAHTRG